jgi:1,4-alpha-glucan branching enzyme/maltooligosyltrehalose trehalohydrolase
MLFMGEEWAASTPFPFFCDFPPELAENVIAGRLEYFSRFPEVNHPGATERIPNPVAEATFASAILKWLEQSEPGHQAWLSLYRKLIKLRHLEIIPCLGQLSGIQSNYHLLSEQVLAVEWMLSKGTCLNLLANLSDKPVFGAEISGSNLLFCSDPNANEELLPERLPAWTTVWYLDR